VADAPPLAAVLRLGARAELTVSDSHNPELSYRVRFQRDGRDVAEKGLATQRRLAVGDLVFSATQADGSSETNGKHIWQVASIDASVDPGCEGVLRVEYLRPHPEHRHHWEDARRPDGTRVQRCACGASTGSFGPVWSPRAWRSFFAVRRLLKELDEAPEE
jgi:hypothetical protein